VAIQPFNLNRKRDICAWIFGTRHVQLGFMIDARVGRHTISQPDVATNNAMTAYNRIAPQDSGIGVHYHMIFDSWVALDALQVFGYT
jgi:hypothetical protein